MRRVGRDVRALARDYLGKDVPLSLFDLDCFVASDIELGLSRNPAEHGRTVRAHSLPQLSFRGIAVC